METPPKGMGGKKAFLYANIFLLLSLVIFFSRSLFTNRIPVTTDILQTSTFFRKPGLPPTIQNKRIMDLDCVDQFVPWFHFNIKSLQSGHLPLWSPYEGCGQPHIANIQSAFFFPLNFLLYLFGIKWGLLLNYLIRLYLCGIFVYLYLSEIQIDFRISILASVAALFTGYNTRWLYHDNSAAAFYIPLGLLAIELLVRHRDSIKGYILLCLGFVLALFAGHPETFYYATVLIFLYTFIRILQEYKKRETRINILLKLAGFAVIAILVSGVQLVPFLEYLLHSYAYTARSAGESQSLIPLSTVLFSLVPNFLSTFLNTKVLYVVFYGFFPTSSVGYTGITMFLLCMTGIIGVRHLHSNIMKTYLILIIFIISIGCNIPVLNKIISIIPLLKMGQGFYMFGNLPLFIIFSGAIGLDAYFKGRLGVKSFFHALLATLGVIGIGFVLFFIQMNKDVGHSLVSRFSLAMPTLADTAGTLIFLFLTLLLIKNTKKQTVLAYGLGILVFAETALPMIPFESAIKPAYFYPRNSIIEALDHQKQPFRIDPLFKSENNEVGQPWPVGIVQYYGFEEPNSYDAMLVNWYAQLIAAMPANEFANLANVKYFIMTGDSKSQFQGMDLKPMLSYNGYTLYKNLSALNRAFMVYDYKTIRTGSHDSNWLDLVKEYGGSLGETAIIPENDEDYATFEPGTGTKGKNDVTFNVYTPSFIKMTVATSEPGLLVISNTYFPGWDISVDHVEKKLIRTDYAFDGVFLKKGQHEVILTYKPLSFLIGLLLSAIGLLGLLLLSAAIKVRQKAVSAKKRTA